VAGLEYINNVPIFSPYSPHADVTWLPPRKGVCGRGVMGDLPLLAFRGPSKGNGDRGRTAKLPGSGSRRGWAGRGESRKGSAGVLAPSGGTAFAAACNDHGLFASEGNPTAAGGRRNEMSEPWDWVEPGGGVPLRCSAVRSEATPREASIDGSFQVFIIFSHWQQQQITVTKGRRSRSRYRLPPGAGMARLEGMEEADDGMPVPGVACHRPASMR